MTEDEIAIRQLIRDWIESSASTDPNRVLSLMSDDVVFLTSSRPPFGKEEFAAATRASAGKVRLEADSEVQEVMVVADLAYCRTRLNVTVTPVVGGGPRRMSGHTLSVFRKQPDGRWLLTRDANLLTPEPPARRVSATVPVLRVASVAKSCDWYRDVLGFAANPFGPPGEPIFAILTRDGVELMLQKAVPGGEAPPAKTELEMSAYVRVVGLEAIREMAAAKVDKVGPIVSREYGCREFRLTDPDGHVLVISERE